MSHHSPIPVEHRPYSCGALAAPEATPCARASRLGQLRGFDLGKQSERRRCAGRLRVARSVATEARARRQSADDELAELTGRVAGIFRSHAKELEQRQPAAVNEQAQRDIDWLRAEVQRLSAGARALGDENERLRAKLTGKSP